MFAGKHDSAVECAEILVVLVAKVFVPNRGAAEDPRDAVPRDGHAALELGAVLWVDAAAVVERLLNSLLWGQRRQRVGMRAERVRAEEDALVREESLAW